MIRLSRHIEILLLSNECVQVPNLGGFVVQNARARYDEREQLFLPPLRILGFNAQLNKNDSLLVQSYVEAYDMGYVEALDAIEDEVRELLRIMGDYGSYELNNLGRLYYDNDGRMNFEPDESGIVTPEFYALSSFEMPMLEVPAVAGAAAESNEVEEEYHPRVVYIGSDNGRKTLNISLRAIRNVSVAVAVAAAVFLVSLPIARHGVPFRGQSIESGFYEMFFPKKSANSEKATTFSVGPKTSSNTSSQVEKLSKSQPAVASKSTLTESEKVQHPVANNVAEKTFWSIVVCSHVTKKNANLLADELRQNGFADAFVSTDGATKVLFGKYASKDEALRKLNELNGGKYFKDAWLLKVNN